MLANTYSKGHSPLFDNPKDYGLAYEDVEFEAEDGVILRGWLIKGGSDKVIIHSHFGCVSSRDGYTPEGKGFGKPWNSKISFLRQAKYMVDDGYSVLLYDFRNHGESNEGSIPWITQGPEENKDVIAAVDFISNHPEYQDAAIGLLSICMGSGSTMYAFGRDDGLSNYENIKCFITVQPVNFDVSMRNNGLPRFLSNRINREITRRVGYDLTKKSFVPSVEKISVPTLVIQNENDPWTEIDHVQDIYNRLIVEKELVMLDLENKRFAAYDYIGTHSEEILGFFGKYM